MLSFLTLRTLFSVFSILSIHYICNRNLVIPTFYPIFHSLKRVHRLCINISCIYRNALTNIKLCPIFAPPDFQIARDVHAVIVSVSCQSSAADTIFKDDAIVGGDGTSVDLIFVDKIFHPLQQAIRNFGCKLFVVCKYRLCSFWIGKTPDLF